MHFYYVLYPVWIGKGLIIEVTQQREWEGSSWTPASIINGTGRKECSSPCTGTENFLPGNDTHIHMPKCTYTCTHNFYSNALTKASHMALPNFRKDLNINAVLSKYPKGRRKIG